MDEPTDVTVTSGDGRMWVAENGGFREATLAELEGQLFGELLNSYRILSVKAAFAILPSTAKRRTAERDRVGREIQRRYGAYIDAIDDAAEQIMSLSSSHPVPSEWGGE